MPVSFKKARVVTPTTTYYDTKFVFHRGTFAIWESDINAWTATRLVLESGATFTKRRRATEPHVLTTATGEQWEIWPLYAGGCNCDAHPLKQVSRDQLLDPDYTFTGTAP